MAKIAINGLGRIGRATLKLVLDEPGLEPVAVNDLSGPDTLAYMLRHDSVYGRYPKEVLTERDTLIIDNQPVKVYNEKDPATLPWGELGIDLVFECTGAFTSREGLEKHLKAGAAKALLSAPGKSDDMPFVVPGVNSSEGVNLFSCASCTTNCISPVVEVMGRRIGIMKAIMTTVHAYTASQGIVDTAAKKPERGRAGAINLVPTSTGAAKAATKVMPVYENRFDGLAIRAPVAVGSIADITFVTDRPTTEKEINAIFREESESDRYRGILGVVDFPAVSSDIIQDPRASIVDLSQTRVVDGDLVKIMSWYDNEWGYAAQMVREAVRAVAS